MSALEDLSFNTPFESLIASCSQHLDQTSVSHIVTDMEFILWMKDVSSKGFLTNMKVQSNEPYKNTFLFLPL